MCPLAVCLFPDNWAYYCKWQYLYQCLADAKKLTVQHHLRDILRPASPTIGGSGAQRVPADQHCLASVTSVHDVSISVPLQMQTTC